MWNRRRTLIAGGALLGVSSMAMANHHAMRKTLPQGSRTSPLIYLSPIKTNGGVSRCQAEVWYAALGERMYVVTDAKAWRARAVQQGLTQATIWVGDVGLWQRSDGKYKQLPSFQANGALADDATEHDAVLQHMSRKYAAEWDTWGPRFRKGLADGSRVMLRYAPA